jgi:arsenite methyltransferase
MSTTRDFDIESSTDESAVHARVRDRYAEAARTVASRRSDPHSGGGCCGPAREVESGPLLYADVDLSGVPSPALLASLGCGNPFAVADLREGETVLDLGSGGGIDVLLSARRVGPSGRAIGLDMTDEMLELARRNAAEAGATNVEFVKGTIESIPLPDASVDVVISNCVINLAADKGEVLREIARVLRPGGRIGISDIVADDSLTPAQRAERGSYVGCIAGALSFAEYRRGLEAVGLADVEVRATHAVADGLHSALVRAVKPFGWSSRDVRRVDLPRPELAVLASAGCCGSDDCC